MRLNIEIQCNSLSCQFMMFKLLPIICKADRSLSATRQIAAVNVTLLFSFHVSLEN